MILDIFSHTGMPEWTVNAAQLGLGKLTSNNRWPFYDIITTFVRDGYIVLRSHVNRFLWTVVDANDQFAHVFDREIEMEINWKEIGHAPKTSCLNG